IPPQPFKILEDMLYCRCCSRTLPLHKGDVIKHVISAKHITKHKEFKDSSSKKQETIQSIKNYQLETDVVGLVNLSEIEQVWRHDVVKSFCKSGNSFQSIDSHSEMLEKYGHALPGSNHLGVLIPFLLKEEKKMLLKEFEGCNVGVMFDGAAWNGECLCIIFRAISDKWTIMQRVVKITLVVKSMNNRNIKSEIVDCILRVMNKRFPEILGFSYDRAGANKKAIAGLLPDFSDSHGLPCIPHTFDRVGGNFNSPRARRFFGHMQSLLALSYQARALFLLKVGFAWPDASDTRWWSVWETYVHMLVAGEDIDTFILDGYEEDLLEDSSNMQKLFTLVFLDNEYILDRPLEMIALVEGGRPFVQATYFLEGDGLLIVHAYDCIKWVESAIQHAEYP
ncbi:unnamed protein product, partial [Heterosigma akashiwo]